MNGRYFPGLCSLDRWSIRDHLLVVLLSGVVLALLRERWGVIFALMAGGVIGCGLAPYHACREMRRLEGRLSAVATLPPRTRAQLVAQSYLLVWAAWYFAGVMVALVGVAAWWVFQNH